MTDPTVEDLDGDPTPEWQEFRKQATQRDWGLPRGTYDAILTGVSTMRRKDSGQWVLRLLARTVDRDRYALAWVALSSETDPYALTPGQRRGLIKAGKALGADSDAPEEIVETIVGLLGKQISAKVVHTPIGPRATFSRSAEVIKLHDPAAAAHQSHELLMLGLGRTREGLVITGQACYELAESEGWLALGYEKLTDYLADPNVSLTRTTFYDFAAVHRRFVIEAQIPEQRLAAADHSKLVLALPAVIAGKVTVEDALADAESLGWRDMRKHYAELMAEPSERSDDPGPDEPAVCSECGRPL
jgi:hypothetical protein